ncbi:unnamed protein product [Knipowitschia caucasica]
MEEAVDPVPAGLGRCTCCFWLALVFDVLGLLVLLLGVFVNVFFYDLLIYAGAIIIFLSLVWWLFWYSGNIEVPPAELRDDVGLTSKPARPRGALGALSGVLRRASSRVTGAISGSFRAQGPRAQQATQVCVGLATVSTERESPPT